MFVTHHRPLRHSLADARREPRAVGCLTAITQRNQTHHVTGKAPFSIATARLQYCFNLVVLRLFTLENCRDFGVIAIMHLTVFPDESAAGSGAFFFGNS